MYVLWIDRKVNEEVGVMIQDRLKTNSADFRLLIAGPNSLGLIGELKEDCFSLDFREHFVRKEVEKSGFDRKELNRRVCDDVKGGIESIIEILRNGGVENRMFEERVKREG